MPAKFLEPPGLTGPPLYEDVADFPWRGGPCDYVTHELDVSLALKWAATLPVNFIEWKGGDMLPLLGCEPWFRNFRITLDGPGRMTTIEAPS